MARAPLTPPLNMVALPQGPISLVVVTETTRPVAPSLLGGRDLTVHTVALAPFRAVAALLTAIDPDLVILEADPGPSWEAVEDVLAVARVGVVLVADVEPAQALALVDRGVDDVIGQAGLEADALEAVVRRAVARRRRLLPPGVSLATVEEGHLEQFVSACPTPLALVDAGDTLVTLNAAARALLGCRAAGEAECCTARPRRTGRRSARRRTGAWWRVPPSAKWPSSVNACGAIASCWHSQIWGRLPRTRRPPSAGTNSSARWPSAARRPC
jgi:hypothetical protein